MKAIIGISLGFMEVDEKVIGIKNNYIKTIKKAGGIPILLPPQLQKDELKTILKKIDGVLISGGCDVDPLFFEEEPEFNLRRIDPARDILEFELIRLALKIKKPLLAICRGIQVLNIACGGTIIQHLDQNHLKHEQQAPQWHATHKVNIEQDNLMYNIFVDKEIRVNSFHHQALGEIGVDLKVTARASDNVVEGVVKQGHPFAVGVQWHPECMIEKYPEQLKLFKELVQHSCDKD